jgi:hypothetical protein
MFFTGDVTFNIYLSTSTLLMSLAPEPPRHTSRNGDRGAAGQQTGGGSTQTVAASQADTSAAVEDANGTALVVYNPASGER